VVCGDVVISFTDVGVIVAVAPGVGSGVFDSWTIAELLVGVQVAGNVTGALLGAVSVIVF
jgi:hypothetical protein